jgi:pimeloyl-ACP methyl ester carboxylesterase
LQRLLRNAWLGPLLARLSSRRFFEKRMAALFGPGSRVEPAELEAMWAGLVREEGRLRLPAISGYLTERVRFRQRWIGALTRFDRPCHILWGRRDPVALAAIASQLAREIPGARLSWLDELGHYPMLEDPQAWASLALSFYAERVRSAGPFDRGGPS